MRAAERFGVRGMLQDERALQIAGAVQAGGQTEMPFEQRARLPEQIEQIVSRHHAIGSPVNASGSGSIQFKNV